MDGVPGVVIDHVPASTRCYVGSPSIIVMPDGSYLASHDFFGPGAGNDTTHVFRSTDRGESWSRIARLEGQVWSNLFLHGDALYIFGTDHCDEYGGRLNGVIVIRRSLDGGETWTQPVDSRSGRLTDEEGWHCAPMPVIADRERLWRAFEFAPDPDRRYWRAVVLSAPEEADLLARSSWLFSEQLDHRWSESQWIEGNLLVAPEGALVNLLRVNDRPYERIPDRAAIVHVDPEGVRLTHDPEWDLIDFPGGGTKFTIRHDVESGRYVSLVNVQGDPPAYRNRLYLSSSADLRSWQVHSPLLQHPDPVHHAFQYVDWVFDGPDILFASRTAYDDGLGGAHRAHDANFLTFHRIEGFRSLLSERIGE
jgi:hypothetical protein